MAKSALFSPCFARRAGDFGSKTCLEAFDPSLFSRLDRCDEPVPLTFGSGIHYCLGSSLVKLEMRLALEHLRSFKSIAPRPRCQSS